MSKSGLEKIVKEAASTENAELAPGEVHRRRLAGRVLKSWTEDFVDEDGDFDEESYEEAKMEAFLDDWLLPYIESLDTSDQIGFFRDQMNASVEMDGNDVSYEVRIPEGIIELAKK